jgi:DNA-3-methyladenine glycosylase
MFAKGGKAYVYLCYGIHHLFNIVTNVENIPHAILIRGVMPVIGTGTISSATGKDWHHYRNFNGPGKVSKALGIRTAHTGYDLTGNKIWIEDRGVIVDEGDVIIGPRVGVDYAGEDAKLKYRFRISEADIHRYTSELYK